ILLFLPIVLEYVLFVMGVGLILSTLHTKFRDFAHIWEVSLQILFYATPILYPISFIPNGLGKIIMVSPLSQILQDGRYLVISKDVVTTWKMLGFPLALITPILVVGVLGFGLWFFLTSAKNFAEEI